MKTTLHNYIQFVEGIVDISLMNIPTNEIIWYGVVTHLDSFSPYEEQTNCNSQVKISLVILFEEGFYQSILTCFALVLATLEQWQDLEGYVRDYTTDQVSKIVTIFFYTESLLFLGQFLKVVVPIYAFLLCFCHDVCEYTVLISLLTQVMVGLNFLIFLPQEVRGRHLRFIREYSCVL